MNETKKAKVRGHFRSDRKDETSQTEKTRMFYYALKHNAPTEVIEGIKLGEYKTLKQLKEFLR